MAGTIPSPTSKKPRFGPEDKARKEKMIDTLKVRKQLSANSEKYIRSGRR